MFSIKNHYLNYIMQDSNDIDEEIFDAILLSIFCNASS